MRRIVAVALLLALQRRVRCHSGFGFCFFVCAEQTAERNRLLLRINLDLGGTRRRLIDDRLGL